MTNAISTGLDDWQNGRAVLQAPVEARGIPSLRQHPNYSTKMEKVQKREPAPMQGGVFQFLG